jgi:epsilon-lactone hydrolase
MQPIRLAVLALAAALAAAPALAEDGVRHLPARDVPVPATVSSAMAALIGAPLQPTWNAHPKSAQEWKALIDRRAAAVLATLPALRARLGVKVEPTTIAGVKAFLVTPDTVAEANRDRLLVHVHGGGYVFFPASAANPKFA